MLLLVTTLATASCAQNPAVGGASVAPGGAARLTQIEALIGDAACLKDSECRVIGIGAMACGGPESFRAWSLRRTDQHQLEELVARDAALRRSEMEKLGMQSTCIVKPVPTVSCVPTGQTREAGRCTLLAPQALIN